MTFIAISLALWLIGAAVVSVALAVTDGEAFDWGVFAIDLLAWPAVVVLLLWMRWHRDSMIF